MPNMYYPGWYPNGYQQSQQPNNVPQQNGITWVQGEAGASAYFVQPGHVAVLFDSTRQVFYIKSCDQMGKPQPLETYDYSKREERASVSPDLSNYVTRDEMKKYIDGLFEEEEKK